MTHHPEPSLPHPDILHKPIRRRSLRVPLATTGELVGKRELQRRFREWVEQLRSHPPLKGHAEREFLQRQLAHLCLNLGLSSETAHVADSPQHLHQIHHKLSKQGKRSTGKWTQAFETLIARCEHCITPTQRMAWQWLEESSEVQDVLPVPESWVRLDYLHRPSSGWVNLRTRVGMPAIIDIPHPFLTAFYSRYILGTTAFASTLALLQQGILFLSLPPFLYLARGPEVIERDAVGRPHSLEGAAIRFADGTGIHCIRGVLIEEGILPIKDDLSIFLILTTDDIEVRRVLIEHVGIESFLATCKAQSIASDDFGTLYHIHIDQLTGSAPEPGKKANKKSDAWIQEAIESTHPDDSGIIAYVRLLNSTPEPGTTADFKEYLLHVPPTCTTPHEAIAWSYDIPQDNYHPLRET